MVQPHSLHRVSDATHEVISINKIEQQPMQPMNADLKLKAKAVLKQFKHA